MEMVEDIARISKKQQAKDFIDGYKLTTIPQVFKFCALTVIVRVACMAAARIL